MLDSVVFGIWEEGKDDAALALQSLNKTQIIESILLPIWEKTIEKILQISKGNVKEWRLSDRAKKIATCRGKQISFEDFQKEVFEKFSEGECYGIS